jgi:hypothetical protein
VTDAKIKKITFFMFGVAFMLVLLAVLTFVFSIEQLPVSGIRNAFLVLTAIFAVAGTGFGLAASVTSGARRADMHF